MEGEGGEGGTGRGLPTICGQRGTAKRQSLFTASFKKTHNVTKLNMSFPLSYILQQSLGSSSSIYTQPIIHIDQHQGSALKSLIVEKFIQSCH